MRSSANPFNSIPTVADLDEMASTADYAELVDEIDEVDEKAPGKKNATRKTSVDAPNPFDAEIDADLIYQYVRLNSQSRTNSAEAKEGKEGKESKEKKVIKSSSKPKRILNDQEVELLSKANDRRPSSTSYQPLTIRRTQNDVYEAEAKALPEPAFTEFDHLLNRNIRAAVDRLAIYEHIVVATAAYSALSAASTEPSFARNVVALIDKNDTYLGYITSWIIATPGGAIQAAFSIGTALNFDIRFLREFINIVKEYIRTGNCNELTKNLRHLASVTFWDIAPSSFGSVVIGYDTFRAYQTTRPALFYLILLGRFKAAFNSNGIYMDGAEKRILIARIKDPSIPDNTFNNYSVIMLMESVRSKLKIFAREHPEEYIEAVNLGFLDSIYSNATYETRVRQLLKLHNFFETLDPAYFGSRDTPFWIKFIGEVFGSASTLVNLVAATKLARMLGLPFLPVVDFFNLWSENWLLFPFENLPLFLGFFALGLFYAGRPSVKANRLINKDSVEQLFILMVNVYTEGFRNHFSNYSATDVTRLIGVLIFGIFYATTKAGSALGYPVLPFDWISEPEAIILWVVFYGLAYMSANGVINNSINRWHRNIFLEFISLPPNQRLNYYNHLDEQNLQSRLIDMISVYLANANNGAFDAMLFTLSKIDQAVSDAALTPQTVAELTLLFPNPLQRAQSERMRAENNQDNALPRDIEAQRDEEKVTKEEAPKLTSMAKRPTGQNAVPVPNAISPQKHQVKIETGSLFFTQSASRPSRAKEAKHDSPAGTHSSSPKIRGASSRHPNHRLFDHHRTGSSPTMGLDLPPPPLSLTTPTHSPTHSRSNSFEKK